MTDTKNTVSDELLAEMLAGLEGVTPGPWYHVKGRGPHHLGWEVGAPNDGISVSKKAEVSAHIARCSPDTMRSILTELQSLRASPSTPVISDEMVERAGRAFAAIAFEAAFEADAESEWHRIAAPMRAALTAALSVKPQSGENL